VLSTPDEKDFGTLVSHVQHHGDGSLPGFFVDGEPLGLMGGDTSPDVLDA
jgi:hypothetical protein